MIRPQYKKLSLTKQCKLLHLNRSSWYYKPCEAKKENLTLMHRIDRQFLETPTYGSRKMVHFLKRQGFRVGRHRVRRLM